jgi:hypothetical protein
LVFFDEKSVLPFHSFSIKTQPSVEHSLLGCEEQPATLEKLRDSESELHTSKWHFN